VKRIPFELNKGQGQLDWRKRKGGKRLSGGHARPQWGGDFSNGSGHLYSQNGTIRVPKKGWVLKHGRVEKKNISEEATSRCCLARPGGTPPDSLGRSVSIFDYQICENQPSLEGGGGNAKVKIRTLWVKKNGKIPDP